MVRFVPAALLAGGLLGLPAASVWSAPFGQDLAYPLGSPAEYNAVLRTGTDEERIVALVFCFASNVDDRARAALDALGEAVKRGDRPGADARRYELVLALAGVAMNACGIRPDLIGDDLERAVVSYGRTVLGARFDGP